MGRPWLVAVWAGLSAVLAALLSVVSGLAVGNTLSYSVLWSLSRVEVSAETCR